VAVLTRRESIDRNLAEYIAERVGKYTRDPREAINIARLVKSVDDIDEAKRRVDKYVTPDVGEKVKTAH